MLLTLGLCPKADRGAASAAIEREKELPLRRVEIATERRARASRPPLLRFTAKGCKCISLLVPVERRKARALVPEGLALFGEASGKALLAIHVTSYEELAFEGARPTAAFVNEVALRIESPDGSAGTHFYSLGLAASSRILARHLRAAGLPCEFVGWLRLDDRDAGDEGHILTTGLPWSPSVCAINARSSELVPNRTAVESVSWNRRSGRLVRRASSWSISSAAMACGQVLSAPGGHLARLAGGDIVTAGGHYACFNAEVSIEPARALPTKGGSS